MRGGKPQPRNAWAKQAPTSLFRKPPASDSHGPFLKFFRLFSGIHFESDLHACDTATKGGQVAGTRRHNVGQAPNPEATSWELLFFPPFPGPVVVIIYDFAPSSPHFLSNCPKLSPKMTGGDNAPADVELAKKEANNNHVARRVAIEKSLKRKLDLRCGLFVLIYILNYLDRNNIGAARLKRVPVQVLRTIC